MSNISRPSTERSTTCNSYLGCLALNTSMIRKGDACVALLLPQTTQSRLNFVLLTQLLYLNSSLYNWTMFHKRRIVLILVFIAALSLFLPGAASAVSSPSMVILTPGNGSTVTAPIPVSAVFQPGADGLIRLTLTDQANITLARQLLRVDASGDAEILFETNLAFEIPNGNTEALLTLSTQDDYHRPLALRSVLVTLSSGRDAQVSRNTAEEPWLEIIYPEPLEIIAGGKFTVLGSVTPITENPIIFELITDTGGVIGGVQLAVNQAGKKFSFELPLTYGFISSVRDVRLLVRQTIDGYATNVILDSLPLALAP